MTNVVLSFILLGFVGGAAAQPQAEIANGHIRVKIYLPDARNGFYRGTRFDWSGVIASLEYKGHTYYGPWFTRTDPKVRDFIYDGPDIVAGPCSAITGPVEEFATRRAALGFAEAKAGGTFIKIGVGVLSKPDDESYSPFRLYEIVDSGKWSIHKASDSVRFTHEISDRSSGYGYAYTKTVRVEKNKPDLVLEHSLKNTGRRPIVSSVYDHNFLVLDRQSTGPDFVITLPFEITTARPPEKGIAEIRGKQILYRKRLENEDRVAFPIQGFGSSPKDYDIRIENSKAGAGVRIRADRPMSSLALWSIRTVLSVEPFIDMVIEPGGEFTWKYTYSYYTLPGTGSR